jgi:triacylglycerol lipase
MIPSVAPVCRTPLRVAGSLVTEAVGEVGAAAHLVRTGGGGLCGSAALPVLRVGTRTTPPVMLVHGLGADSSSFQRMAAALHRAGHTVYLVNYSCRGVDIASCGRQLAVEAASLCECTGAQVVHVVAHSLGGVVLRWAVDNTRMGDCVGTAVTLGSPHGGSPLARLAPRRMLGFGQMVRQLRPTRSREGDRAPGPRGTVRWVAVAAQLDWIVPPRFALLPESPHVRNVVLPGGGHLSLPSDARCVDLVRAELESAPEPLQERAA